MEASLKTLNKQVLLSSRVNEIKNVVEKLDIQKYDPGFFNGAAGLLTFWAYYDRIMGDNNQQHIQQITEYIFESLHEKWPSASICTGLTGILFALKDLEQNELSAYSIDFNEFDALIINELNTHANNGFWDYLHGGNGIFYYLISYRSEINIVQEALFHYIDQLYQKAIFIEDKVYWKSYTLVGGSPVEVINPSLSHGMGSTIIILSLFLKKFPSHAKAQELLEKSVSFLLSLKNPPGIYRSIYPSLLHELNARGESRLGWCYGDLSFLISYQFAFQVLNKPHLKQEIYHILKHSIQRTDLTKDRILDAGICHGSSGLAFLMKRFHEIHPFEELREQSEFWCQTALEMNNHLDGYAGYKMFHGELGWRKNAEFLEGIAGIGLVFLHEINPTTKPLWNRVLLLDFDI